MGAALILLIRRPDIRKSSKGMPVRAIPAYLLYGILLYLLSSAPETSYPVDPAAHLSGFFIGLVTYLLLTNGQPQGKYSAAD